MTHATRSHGRSSGLSRFLVAAVASLAVVLGGCEAIVGDTVPSMIMCAPLVAGACGAGSECLDGFCKTCANPGCVTFVMDAGHDTSVPMDAGHDTSVPFDAGHDAGHDVTVEAPMPEASAPAALGAPCSGNTGCASGFCATPGDIPSLNLSNGFCSAPCCADSDCVGTGTLGCYAAAGGNLCVPSTVEGCSGSSCLKACCGSTGCSTNDSCALPDGGAIPSCQPYGGDQSACASDGAGGDDCDVNSDCQSGLCIGGNGVCSNSVCTQPCCSDSQCSGSDTCQWLEVTLGGTPTGVVHACQPPAGSSKTGDSCTSGSACAGNVCAGSICTGPCCTDSDCAGLPNGHWKCLPYEYPLSVGTIPVLACQLAH
jgi:hypothetical protein